MTIGEAVWERVPDGQCFIKEPSQLYLHGPNLQSEEMWYPQWYV